jgi:hypothetical protein
MAEPKSIADEFADLTDAKIADDFSDLLETPATTSLQRLKAVAKQRPPAKDPGFLSTVGHGLLQGFFKGGSDEAVGGLTRAGVSPGAGAAWRMPDGSEVPLNTGWDVYRAGRDTERETLRGARENRPKTAFAAEFLGDLASDAVLSGLGVPGVGNRAYNVGTGMLSGLLGSEAELTPDKATGDDVLRAGLATALGGAAGDLGTTIGEGASRATPAMLRAARGWLERRGINLGRRALMSGSQQLAGTVPVSDDAVREALASGAILPFGTTQGAAQRLERSAEHWGRTYGATLQRLEELGVRGPDAEALARRLIAEGDEEAAVAGANTAVPNVFYGNADAIESKVLEPRALDVFARLRLAQMGVTPTTTSSAVRNAGGVFDDILSGTAVPQNSSKEEALAALRRLRLAQAGVTPPPAAPAAKEVSPQAPPRLVELPDRPADLPLSQAEGLKRTLQGEAKYGRIEDTPVNEAKRRVASMMRQAIEDKVDEAALTAAPGSELDAMTGAFMPVKQRLSRTLAASEAADKGAAAAAKRAGLSLTDYLWGLGAGGAGLLGGGGGGGMLGAGAAMLGHRFLRNRGPSTGAATAYWASRLAGAGANAAAANPSATRKLESLAASKMLGDQLAPVAEENQGRAVQSAISRYLSRINAAQENP